MPGKREKSKLFREWFSLSAIEHEARVARIVHESGLPVPAVGDLVEIAGRHGLVYERVIGVSMLKTFESIGINIYEVSHNHLKIQLVPG